MRRANQFLSIDALNIVLLLRESVVEITKFCIRSTYALVINT